MAELLLESLTLHDFRNVAAAELILDPGFNLIVGANGQGKSNLLESVGLLATGRSFRRTPPSLLRRTGSRFFRIEGRVRVDGVRHRLAFAGQAEGQQAWCNGKPLAVASALGEIVTVVVVAAETLRLVKGSPADRRAFLDWLIFGSQRGHLQVMRDYQKAVLARNALLRRPTTVPEFEAWEDRIATLGAAIVLARRHGLAALLPVLQTNLDRLGLAGEQCLVRYASQAGDGEEREVLAARYRTLLAASRDSDRRHLATSVGPHRDDLRLIMAGQPLLRYASQGQQRRFVLGLKLAEWHLLARQRGLPPILLLDDPMAEMDLDGVNRLLEILAGTGGQLLVASCRPEEIRWPGQPGACFQVISGVFDRLQQRSA